MNFIYPDALRENSQGMCNILANNTTKASCILPSVCTSVMLVFNHIILYGFFLP